MDATIAVIDTVLALGFRLAVWMVFLWLDKRVPVIRHIDEDELWNYRYPSMDSIVPKQWLYVIIFGIPALIFTCQYILNRKTTSALLNILCNVYGITLAFCINGIFTAMLKLTVGRPRPNFFRRCFPDGYGTDIDNCTGEYHGLMDGRKSFPSGHASFAFTAMVYMTLHLCRLIDLKKRGFCRGIIVFALTMPILLATLIGVSRLADYHHHYTDVIGGAILGTTIAFLMENVYSSYDESDEQEMASMLKEYKQRKAWEKAE